jgi:hypothetical protein
MEWRPATSDDSFTQGEAVVLTDHDLRGVVVDDAPAGSASVRVELQQGERVGTEWDYAQLGNVTEIPPLHLSVLRED